MMRSNFIDEDANDANDGVEDSYIADSEKDEEEGEESDSQSVGGKAKARVPKGTYGRRSLVVMWRTRSWKGRRS